MDNLTTGEDDAIKYITADWENYDTPKMRDVLKNIAVNPVDGWARLDSIKQFCELNNATIEKGERDNRTDGEIDWYVTAKNGAVQFIIKGKEVSEAIIVVNKCYRR